MANRMNDTMLHSVFCLNLAKSSSFPVAPISLHLTSLARASIDNDRRDWKSGSSGFGGSL